MQNLPVYVSAVFIITTLLTLFLFFKAHKMVKFPLLVITIWVLIQSGVSLSGFYTVTSGMPPRFVLLLLPTLVLIAALFVTPKGRAYINSLDKKYLTLLHSIRIPVEVVLYWLCLYKYVPAVMTIEGRNLDILSGISALLVYFFIFIKKQTSRKTLLAWNIASLLLLINIVLIALVSAPFPFQQMAFDQPNIALLYFPFTLLPCCIVPLVFFSHLVVIRQLIKPVLVLCPPSPAQ